MASLVAVLEDRLATLDSERTELLAKAEKDESFDDVRERLDEIEGQDGKSGLIASLTADINREKARRAQARSMPAAPGTEAGPVTPLGDYGPELDLRSIGDRFLADESWREFIAKVAPGGSISEKRRIDSPAQQFKSIISPPRGRMRAAAPIRGGTATSAAELIIPGQSGIFDDATQRPLTIRDVVTTGTTDSDLVEYVRVTSITNAAAPVVEADDVDPTDTTGLKPQSDMAFLRVQAPVITIAHWVAATKRALSDAGQLRTIIDNFLRYGLEEELEDQIVAGAGGDGFTGLVNDSDVQDQAFDTDLLTTARRAKTKVRVVGRARANAYLFHPNDWENVDLELTFGGGGTNNRQAAEESTPRLWGLPVVESEAVPEGTAFVGDFRNIVLWDREQANITASDGVNNFFLKNLVAILAEMRAALGIVRPEAFVQIDLGS